RRLHNFVDAPYIEGPDIFGTEDNSQLFCLREGVVNFCAHTDYFAAAHPTIRVFSDRISMQNPGRFILDADEFRSRILSMPRNPSIIKFFRYPKLAENAGYGIEKIFRWERLTGKPVIFHSDLLVSTVEYPISRKLGENNGENNGKLGENNGENNGKLGENNGENNGKYGENIILEAIRKDVFISQPKLAELTGFSQRKVNRIIAALRDAGKIRRIGKTKGGHWEIID
ncbi:MAG: ATP-binding protein, partial [Bacteroidales bacterium]|nr:ATP-binding protein [Bacteroidales bacterium]